MASLAEFLSMPMFGGPNARPVGLDELGNVAYRPVMGPDYRVVKQAPNRDSVVKGFLSQLMDAPGATLGGLAKGAAQGAWDAVATPGRSWSDTVTYGDVANTAGLVSLPAVAGKYDPNRIGIFGGINAKTADKAALARAQDMAAKGVSRDDIWTETGWFAGPDGKWRFEIDDSGATWKRGTIDEKALKRRGTLDRSLNHADLFDAYPDMRDTALRPDYGRHHDVGGSYLSDEDAIMVNRTGPGWRDTDAFDKVVFHEGQHSIQNREGFATGGNINVGAEIASDRQWAPAFEAQRALDKVVDALPPEYRRQWDLYQSLDGDERWAMQDRMMKNDVLSPVLDLEWETLSLNNAAEAGISSEDAFQTYRRIAGEAEARNVEARRHMNAAERRATPPWNTLDVPEDELILRYGSGPQASIRAYHGSPHDFDRFDMSKVGTGEGAQAYGHGLYFAEAEDVARQYRDNLSGGRMMNAGVSFDGGDVFDAPDGTRAILQELDPILRKTGSVDAALKELDDRAANARLGYTQIRSKDMADFLRQNRDRIEYIPPGRMYEVDINADPADFLDWDAPLSEQPAKVRDWADKVAGSSYIGRKRLEDSGATGRDVWEKSRSPFVARGAGYDEWAGGGPSRAMSEAGIPGIKYYDQGSRAGKEGTRNYVVFDDSLIEILRKYGLAGAMLGAGVYPQEEGGI